MQNVYEAQGPFNTDNAIMDRIQAAFEFMEEKVAEGKIKSYGMATYSCFRTKPTEHKIHLNLQKIYKLAEKAAGEGKQHSFKFVQVPMNILMPEAFCEPW